MSKWLATVAFVALAIFSSASGADAEQAPLRIAMTMADIPLTDGAPDQGTEGIRFLGYTCAEGRSERWFRLSGGGRALDRYGVRAALPRRSPRRAVPPAPAN